MNVFRGWIAFSLFFLFPNFSSSSFVPFVEGREIVFGRVHDDPVRSIRDRQEFVDYIAKRLSPFGITAGRILVVEKMHILAQALRDGKVDLFHDSVVPTMLMSNRAGAIPILRQWKYGEPDYEGLIVVRRNSGINSLNDLKGRTIAFEEPHSTSATVLPRMLLEEKKLKLVEIKAPGKAKADAVGFMYGTDGNAVNVLITGRSDAATTIRREIERLKPEIRDSLKVIGETFAVPRQVIAIRKDLDPQLVKALKDILTSMDQDSEGRGVLQRQQNTTKIDEIPPKSYELMKRLEKHVFSSMGKEVDSW